MDRLKKIIVEHLGVSEDKVKPEANFVDDLKADSLDLTDMLLGVEEEFGIEIADEDAQKMLTVQDAIDYVESKKA